MAIAVSQAAVATLVATTLTTTSIYSDAIKTWSLFFTLDSVSSTTSRMEYIITTTGGIDDVLGSVGKPSVQWGRCSPWPPERPLPR